MKHIYLFCTKIALDISAAYSTTVCLPEFLPRTISPISIQMFGFNSDYKNPTKILPSVTFDELGNKCWPHSPYQSENILNFKEKWISHDISSGIAAFSWKWHAVSLNDLLVTPSEVSRTGPISQHVLWALLPKMMAITLVNYLWL